MNLFKKVTVGTGHGRTGIKNETHLPTTVKHCLFCGTTAETRKLFCTCGQMLKTTQRAAAVLANTEHTDSGASNPSAMAHRTFDRATTG